MLTKWIDHPPGICEWDVRIALKGLGIRKCMSLGLASCMLNIRFVSITFSYSLFMCYHGKSLGSTHVSQPPCNALHLSWTVISMRDNRYLDWEVASQLGNYWRHSFTCWLYWSRQFPQHRITCYQMGLSIQATHYRELKEQDPSGVLRLL